MVEFLIVFFVFIFGFATSFYTLSDAHEEPLTDGIFEAFKFSFDMATNVFDT